MLILSFFLHGGKNQAFQFFGQFRVVLNDFLGRVATLSQLGVVVAEL